MWLKRFRFRRYRLADLPGLLRSPIGRSEIWYVLLQFIWPVSSRFAALYRRLVIRKVPIVAVVGSFGKTTAARAAITALGGCIGARFGQNSLATIPGALFHVRRSDASAVLEIGIGGPGQMAGIARTVRPDIAVVTSIGSEHSTSFKSLEVTRHEKAHMVRVLPPSGVAVLNGDDPNVLWMAGQTRARVVTFGFGEANQVRASDPRIEWPHGTRFRLHLDGEAREAHLRLLGGHMIYPALAAVAVARLRGERLEEVLARLAALPPTPGRLAPRPLANGAVLLCDTLKSGLETIHAALDVLAEISAPRKIVVLGPITEPVGPQGPLYRELGRRIAGIAQLAVLVDSYQEYRGGLRQGGMPRDTVFDAGHGFSGAVEFLRRELRAGDVVLLKGRLSQKLERIALALEGVPVRCRRINCQVHSTQCDHCPLLERG